MAGILPDEGETFIANYLLGLDLQLGLFTNTSISETTTESTLTEPSGGGYARISLPAASGSVSGDTLSFTQKTFTASGTSMTGIYGYFICTLNAPKKIIAIELDSAITPPLTLLVNDTYKVTPAITVA